MANERILIIDDDPDLVEVVRLTLQASGFQVFSAAGGAEGLQKVKEIDPDLIILDVMMDYTTEGFQVSLELRSQDPASEYASYRDIPILMLTAIHSTTPLRFGPEEDYLPVDGFVEKPLEPGDLVKKVEDLLRK
ncbi:MAG: response regulator transcription factor [Anaerolineae bacterium]|jgi:CheY-like chemotaxis protein